MIVATGGTRTDQIRTIRGPVDGIPRGGTPSAFEPEIAEIHRLSDFLFEPRGHASELVQELSHLLGGGWKLVRSKHEQGEEEYDDDFSSSDIEHPLMLTGRCRGAVSATKRVGRQAAR